MFNNHFAGRYTHNKHAVVSWKKLFQDSNYTFIDSESLPSGTVLNDPSKLQSEEINVIWSHWMRRQKANSQGLVFLKAHPGDMREEIREPQQKRPQKQNVEEEDFFSPANNEGGPSQPPHPESPAAHAKSLASKVTFLRTLSSDLVYQMFVDLLDSKEEVRAMVNGLHRLHLIIISHRALVQPPIISLPGVIGSGTRSICPPNSMTNPISNKLSSWRERTGVP